MGGEPVQGGPTTSDISDALAELEPLDDILARGDRREYLTGMLQRFMIRIGDLSLATRDLLSLTEGALDVIRQLDELEPA